MAYICLDCGHIFCEGEQVTWRESRGEYCGNSCYEQMSGCPLCFGQYVRSAKCKICKCESLEDDLHSGICEDCAKDYWKDFDFCYKVSKNFSEKTAYKEEVKILDLFARAFSEKKIEEILYEYAKAHPAELNLSLFFDIDKDWFCEEIWKEVKNNENAKDKS